MTRPFPSKCAFCGCNHNLISQVTEKKSSFEPEAEFSPGDATLCINCGEMNVLGEDYDLRRPTEEETADMANDPRVKFLREGWLALKATRQ